MCQELQTGEDPDWQRVKPIVGNTPDCRATCVKREFSEAQVYTSRMLSSEVFVAATARAPWTSYELDEVEAGTLLL